MNHTHQDFADLIDADIASAFEAALGGNPSGQAADALPMVWFDEIQPNLDNLWLIDDVLPRTGVVTMHGHPGTGKSFIAIDMSLHIALGWQWRDFATVQGLVVYVGAEGLAGLTNRISAFRNQHAVEGKVPFALIPTPIDMQSPTADTNRLITSIADACRITGHDPRLIVIDTLSKTFGGGKENGEDMVSYVANCERVAARFGCCVMPVHHRPKDAESKEPRGHSSLKGGSDTVLLVEKGKITVDKQKDGEDGAIFHFALRKVELGVNNKGGPVTSCLVEHSDSDNSLPADPKAAARKKLSGMQRQVFTELGKCLEHHGEAVPQDIPDSHINSFMTTKVVSREVWRDTYLAVACDGQDDRDTKRDDNRRNFNRSVTALQNKGLVGLWEGYAWLN